MGLKYPMMMVAAAMCAMMSVQMPVHADDSANVRHIAGEITWIDVKLGELQLEVDKKPNAEEVSVYRISEHETRVSNPSDEKFLTIKDLNPGQHVIVDVIRGQEDRIIQQITADPRSTVDFEEAYGEIEAIDVEAGTLTLAGNSRAGDDGQRYRSNFIFEPRNITVLQGRKKEPIAFELKPGDIVKVAYVVKDGKNHARTINVYAPRVSSTTTTTVTTTTR